MRGRTNGPTRRCLIERTRVLHRSQPPAVVAQHYPPAGCTHTHSQRTHRTHPCHTRGRRWHTHSTTRTMHATAVVGGGGRWGRAGERDRHHSGVGNWEQREGSKGGATGVHTLSLLVAQTRYQNPGGPENHCRPRSRKERGKAGNWSPTWERDGRDPVRTAKP